MSPDQKKFLKKLSNEPIGLQTLTGSQREEVGGAGNYALQPNILFKNEIKTFTDEEVSQN